MNKIQPDHYAKILWEISQVSDGKLRSSQLNALAKEIVSHNHAPWLAKIEKALESLIQKESGITPLTLITSSELPAATLASIQKEFSKKIPHVKMTHEIRPEILGGAQVRLHDQLFDASLKNALTLLRSRLNSTYAQV